jgi:DNA-directed RNA polymerase III subunit RPC8
VTATNVIIRQKHPQRYITFLLIQTITVDMFIITTTVDTIRVPAHMLALPALVALHKEIDLKYPNRVLMDVGLVVCRYGDCLKITNGTCVPGDGGSHHDCLFRLVVFRPFVEEVCLGKIVKSTAEGVQVSLGFFQDIFIPAYWMLRPSQYDEKIGLWVWTPDYDEDGEKTEKDEGEGAEDDAVVDEDKGGGEAALVKMENGSQPSDDPPNESVKLKEEEGDRFEMDIGAEIRFKVKSIQFTQVTNTAKGVQATTTTTAHSHTFPKENEEKTSDKPLRKRSLSVDLSDANNVPASMHIVASICEDGLGLTSWWTSGGGADDEDDDSDDAEH